MSILFTPFTLRGLTIPNRIAMAPMTRNFSPSGCPAQMWPNITAAAPKGAWG